MINILSYVGINLQYEVCLWALLGLISTVFDATLFKVNANLKQVWQMTMPTELSMPVQRILRTMISGIMLVQCFTVYVYLATYIVLLYPIFLEERPILVLPWLLLSACRKLLCELTSLALGLGTCVLLGPGRPPCIKFVITKIGCILPCFYMWMLILSYYHNLKLIEQFKLFPAVLPQNSQDYGLELAVRRRKTKSLLDEDILRKKLVASLYGERPIASDMPQMSPPHKDKPTKMVQSTETNPEECHGEMIIECKVSQPLQFNSSFSTRMMSEIGTFEDWFGSEVTVPRSDRVIEQFVLMLLRIGVYKKNEHNKNLLFLDTSLESSAPPQNIDYNTTHTSDHVAPPPHVGSVRGMAPSYVTDYPDIFMKRSQEKRSLHNARQPSTELEINIDDLNNMRLVHRTSSTASAKAVRWEIERSHTTKVIKPNKNVGTSKPETADTDTSMFKSKDQSEKSTDPSVNIPVKEQILVDRTTSRTSSSSKQMNKLVVLHDCDSSTSTSANQESSKS